MSGDLDELLRRIKENEGRGFILISEPKPITTSYSESSYNCSDLKRIKRVSRELDFRTKWICKMRLSPTSAINYQQSIAKLGKI